GPASRAASCSRAATSPPRPTSATCSRRSRARSSGSPHRSSPVTRRERESGSSDVPPNERTAIVTRQQTTATLVLGLAALLAAAEPVAAGEQLGTNLFGGYSYLKLDESSRHGATLALDFHAFGRVAGFVDVSTHWG